MTLASLPLPGSLPAQGLRLSPYAIARPALSSHVRPALVLPERETRELFTAARSADVASGGRFAATPAGIQLWDRPFDGPDGTHGTAVHLGTVDWSYDTPARDYATVYRSIVTAAGAAAGCTPESVLRDVLALAEIPLDGSRVTAATPPPRDPFRSRLAS